MKNKIISISAITTFIILLLYSLIGTNYNVSEIKSRVPLDALSRNWKIMRYEGFQYGSWSKNGGKAWYHFANIDNPDIQYRACVTLWNGELQYYYNEPENLNRINVNLN